ncbi:MAG: phosphohydrolase [Sulfobacillus benefaciens]|jgi:hypothetical protein|uniref:Phosphohydrolase n=1 Tax=Sulfobacillus benefaciens TaxID=453960 RepID=A0A2T2WWB6_9FIRM|nr:MAG: phosphohydrolase [Sulfobacillus benefaciens]
MRLLPISQLQPGDVSADALRSTDGRILLREGVILTESVIDALSRWDIPALPVKWPGFEDIDTAPALPAAIIDEMTQWAAKSGDLNWDIIREAQRIVRKIWDEQLDRHRQAFELIGVYQVGTPFLTFYVNLVALVMRLGHELVPEWTQAYTLAAMLMGFHHGGLKTGEVLDPDPGHGLQMAAQLRQFQIPAPAMTALLQHHARYDGNGMPTLKGVDIYRGAMILGLAEEFLTLVFRTDNHSLPAHEALEWIIGGAGVDFSLETVTRLQRTVAPYATGQVVVVDNHDVAVVREVPWDWPARPTIGLLSGRERGNIVDLREVNQQNRVITGIYRERLWPGSRGSA